MCGEGADGAPNSGEFGYGGGAAFDGFADSFVPAFDFFGDEVVGFGGELG